MTPNLRPMILYFFPDARAVPVLYADRIKNESGKGAEGPDQKRGIIGSPDPEAVCQYDKGRRWVKVMGVYIGIRGDYTPADFARSRQFPGYSITLADGQEWDIPICNPMFPTCGLPFTEVRDESGEWVREIKDQYRALADKALATAGQFREAVESKTLSWGSEDEVRQAVADIISLNYDLTFDELEALRLFDPETYLLILEAFIDWPTMQELMVSAAVQLKEGGDLASLNPTEGMPDGSDTASGVQD